MKQESDLQSISEALTQLERDWNRKNLTIEISTSEAGRLIENKWERDIQEYSLSSSNRRRFFMYVIRAAYEEEPISWKQLIQSLNISRNALDTMVNECVGAGWVIEHKSDKRVNSTFTANDNLIETYDNYSAWVRRSCKNLGIRTTASAIIELQALIDTEYAKKYK
jgi:predicted transcriptional regulator